MLGDSPRRYTAATLRQAHDIPIFALVCLQLFIRGWLLHRINAPPIISHAAAYRRNDRNQNSVNDFPIRRFTDRRADKSFDTNA